MVVLVSLLIQDIHGEKFEVQVESDAEVLGLKLQIWEQRQIPPESQRLVFAGRQLQDDETLAAVGAVSGSVIFMVQQGSQTQAVVQPVVAQPAVVPAVAPAAYTQPNGYAPGAVQSMNIQAAQPGAVANPVMVVPEHHAPEETCCCCIPLRVGVMILLGIQVIGHFGMFGDLWFLAIFCLMFDAAGVYGWVKKFGNYLRVYSFFMIFELVGLVIWGAVAFGFAMTSKYPHHHHHRHGHHHNNGYDNNEQYGYPTTTVAPHALSTQQKAWFSVLFVLVAVLVIMIGSYFIRAVYRYSKNLQGEDQRARVQVDGVVYEQV